MTLKDAAYQAMSRDVTDGGWDCVYYYEDHVYTLPTAKETVQIVDLNYLPPQISPARDGAVLWGLIESVLEEP